MTLDQLAVQQQRIVTLKKQGVISLGTELRAPSDRLVAGNHSDRSNPLTAPWVTMPDGGFPFSSNGTITTPLAGTGWTDVIGPAGQYVMQVPNGNDGVINQIINVFNGQGFVQGSGALIWRILINGQAVRNYDNMLVQLGSTSSPFPIAGIRVTSQDTIQFQVNNVSLVQGGTQIFCFLGGWYYPNKLSIS